MLETQRPEYLDAMLDYLIERAETNGERERRTDMRQQLRQMGLG